MTAPFVCERCGTSVSDPHKRFERRIEFRSVRTQGRYKVVLDEHLCKECVDEEIAIVRPPSNQASFL